MMDNSTYTKSSRERSTRPQYVKTSYDCGSAFTCGAEYTALNYQVQQLADKVQCLEEENNKMRENVKLTNDLLKLQRFIMILLPILELVVVGIVIYFFSDSNAIGYTIVGLIGITTLLNGFYLPNKISSLEERINKIEKEK